MPNPVMNQVSKTFKCDSSLVKQRIKTESNHKNPNIIIYQTDNTQQINICNVLVETCIQLNQKVHTVRSSGNVY